VSEINQNLLNGLNPSQLDAIQTLEGPVLVQGRAGKNKVLTTRIANLIATTKGNEHKV
jgi:DNA helicase-2/ATP-dependent DNA helicase PcrA